MERLKLESSNFELHTDRLYRILAYGWQITPRRGVVTVTWPIINFDARNHISEMAEARLAKFCMQVEYVYQILALASWHARLIPNGRDRGHVTRFFNFAPNHIFGIGETRHFKCCEMSWGIPVHRMIVFDRLPPKGMCWGSRDLFKFWKIAKHCTNLLR